MQSAQEPLDAPEPINSCQFLGVLDVHWHLAFKLKIGTSRTSALREPILVVLVYVCLFVVEFEARTEQTEYLQSVVKLHPVQPVTYIATL